MLVATLLLVIPGALIAWLARLPWPISIAAGPALTYGTVGLAIVPFGAIGIPWNALTALAALGVVLFLAAVFRVVLERYRDHDAEALAATRWPALCVGAGVVVGATLIGCAAVAALPHWQSIPSTWDSVWHANTIRSILDTGQASPTHMGELRNVETHARLFYPSTFHALAAVLAQLTGAAPTTAYTLSSLAAAIWLFPSSAAALAWHLMRPHTTLWATAGCATAAAGLAASFTAVPYVEFNTAATPNLAAYGIAAPTMVLIVSALRHRDRIPIAVLALIGVFSVHTTAGVIAVVFVAAWWLVDGLRRPVRGRVSDMVALLLIVGTTALAKVPQVIGILEQAEIIAGHSFVSHEGKKRALLRAVLQYTRHLSDYPIQYTLLVLAAVGAVILLVKRVWWPLAVWLLLVGSVVYSAAPFGGVIGALIRRFSDSFYSDPRRLSAAITLLLTPMAGIGLFMLVAWVANATRGLLARRNLRIWGSPAWNAACAMVVIGASIVGAWHYFPRHRFLLGEKYDQVMIDDKDLEAMAYLATLPGARETLIGNANTDGTAWMYAVAGLHPLWTHYDYPQQLGPGYHRFIFWAYADDADGDPRVAQAVQALDIRYVLTSTPVVGDFVMPDGLTGLEESHSWTKIYDNGEARIYEWRPGRTAPAPTKKPTT
ncbi:membrane protein [Mycobacterium bourgelatii]|uniref:Membrane protein n=1 Tax=Mycobacterium bourgelatii TaxID=1273442 RepID=A0A7I9YR05_MYCBU|nr:membrane protein [Mycobacterium bourgelatii]